LIQTMGRAARHIEGQVILYADSMTGSMDRAIKEVQRRRDIQLAYNKKHGITPESIQKPIREKLVDRDKIYEEKKKLFVDEVLEGAIARAHEGNMIPEDRTKLVKILTREMKDAAKILDFEKAAVLRDQILALKS